MTATLKRLYPELFALVAMLALVLVAWAAAPHVHPEPPPARCHAHGARVMHCH